MEAQRNLQIAQQPKIEAQNAKRQLAAEALLLLNPEEALTSSVGVPHTVSTGNLDIVTSRMTDIINLLYGKKLVEEWRDSAEKARLGRDIYEISTATTQCMNTVGRAEDAGGCWICGFSFDSNVPGMGANCDHILPVAQAVFFLGLYSTRKTIPTEPTTMNDTIYKLEYAWAHMGCNILKSNRMFIHGSQDPIHKTPIWSVDTNEIKKLLLDIKGSKVETLQAVQKQIVNPQKWLDTRTKAMTKKIKKITDFISRPEEPGLGDLTVLAGWASMVDPTSMTDEFLDFIHVDLPPNVVSAKRRKRSLSPASDTEQPPPAKRSRSVSPPYRPSSPESVFGKGRRRKTLRRKKGRKSHKTYKWRRLY
jgi:hypothetical protein